MIVPHHGSKTSSTAEFIAQVNPKLAIASVAKDNRWNLPNPQVVARYQAQQVEWLDTGQDGQISLFSIQISWIGLPSVALAGSLGIGRCCVKA